MVTLNCRRGGLELGLLGNLAQPQLNRLTSIMKHHGIFIAVFIITEFPWILHVSGLGIPMVGNPLSFSWLRLGGGQAYPSSRERRPSTLRQAQGRQAQDGEQGRTIAAEVLAASAFARGTKLLSAFAAASACRLRHSPSRLGRTTAESGAVALRRRTRRSGLGGVPWRVGDIPGLLFALTNFPTLKKDHLSVRLRRIFDFKCFSF